MGQLMTTPPPSNIFQISWNSENSLNINISATVLSSKEITTDQSNLTSKRRADIRDGLTDYEPSFAAAHTFPSTRPEGAVLLRCPGTVLPADSSGYNAGLFNFKVDIDPL